MNLQEHIRRILKEETEGISSFINELSNVFNISDELKDEVTKFNLRLGKSFDKEKANCSWFNG